MAVLNAARLAQPIAGKIAVAPLATKALRVDVGEPAALVVVLVGLQQTARTIGDAGEASGGIIGVAPNFGLAAEVQSAFCDAPRSSHRTEIEGEDMAAPSVCAPGRMPGTNCASRAWGFGAGQKYPVLGGKRTIIAG